jgi:hypothetical protein
MKSVVRFLSFSRRKKRDVRKMKEELTSRIIFPCLHLCASTMANVQYFYFVHKQFSFPLKKIATLTYYKEKKRKSLGNKKKIYQNTIFKFFIISSKTHHVEIV